MHFIFAGLPVLLTSKPAEDNIRIEEGLGVGKFGLHDVLAAKSFSYRNNSLRNRCWIGGKDDWLVIIDKACDMKLFNPVVGVNVCLPSFNTITGIHVDDYNELDIVYAPISRRPYNHTISMIDSCFFIRENIKIKFTIIRRFAIQILLCITSNIQLIYMKGLYMISYSKMCFKCKNINTEKYLLVRPTSPHRVPKYRSHSLVSRRLHLVA